jgi:HK97 family phage major capsid protein
MSDEMKKAIDEFGSAITAQRKELDELRAKQEKGEGGQAEIQEKVAKLDEVIEAQLDMKKNLEETALAVKNFNKELDGSQSNGKKDLLDAYGVALKKIGRARGHVERAGLSEKETEAMNEVKAMSREVGPDGGYTLMPFLGETFTRPFDTSPVRQLASVVTISTDTYKGFLDDDEAAASWIGETASRPTTDTPELGKLNIPVHEMYAFPKATESLLEDSEFNLPNWLMTKVSDKFSRTEAAAFISGDGVDKPRGLMTYAEKTASASEYTRGQVGTKVAATASAITTDELVDTRALLHTSHRPNAYWGYNRATESVIRKLVDGQGNYIWQPVYAAGEPDQLLGQRTVIMEDMDDIATGNKPVVLADFRDCYLVVDRLGMSVLEDRFSDKPYIGYYTRKRVGGALKSYSSIKYLKMA